MYSTSIRLTIVQGISPLKASVACLFFGGIGLVQLPLTSKMLERYTPRWVLFTGLVLIGASGLVRGRSDERSDTDRNRRAVDPRGRRLGARLRRHQRGRVNTLPNHLAGMASGATSTFRDLGFALGPAIMGAFALSQAAKEISRNLADNPSLSKAYVAFQAAPAHAPADQEPQLEAAEHAVGSGPLGANSVPGSITSPDGQVIPFNPLKRTSLSTPSAAVTPWHSCSVAWPLWWQRPSPSWAGTVASTRLISTTTRTPSTADPPTNTSAPGQPEYPPRLLESGSCGRP